MTDYNESKVSPRPWIPKIKYKVWSGYNLTDENGDYIQNPDGSDCTEKTFDSEDEFIAFIKGYEEIGYDLEIEAHCPDPDSIVFTGNAIDDRSTSNYQMGFRTVTDALHAFHCVNEHDRLTKLAELVPGLVEALEYIIGGTSKCKSCGNTYRNGGELIIETLATAREVMGVQDENRNITSYDRC